MEDKTKREISEEDRKINHKLLDKIMDGCLIDSLTGQFYCKKCKCIAHIDWNNHYVYCVTGGILCICTKHDEE